MDISFLRLKFSWLLLIVEIENICKNSGKNAPKAERCVWVNSLEAQEPFEFDS